MGHAGRGDRAGRVGDWRRAPPPAGSTAADCAEQPAGTEAEGTVDLGTGPGGSLPGAGIDISFIQGVKGD